VPASSGKENGGAFELPECTVASLGDGGEAGIASDDESCGPL